MSLGLRAAGLLLLVLGACTPKDLSAEKPQKTDPDPFVLPEGGAGHAGNDCVSAGASGVSGTRIPCVDAGMPDAGVERDCHEFQFTYSGKAKSVWISGEFTSWGETPDAGALVMTETAPDMWTYDYTSKTEGTFEYKLIIDGTRWIPDPANKLTAADGFGGVNSVLSVCVASAPPVVCGFDTFDWHDPVMYFAMTDRFYDSDGKAVPVAGAEDGNAATGPSAQYEGGDIKGVTEKVAYLADMGVTALWLSAPYENREVASAAVDPVLDPHMYSAYHGYWPSPADIDYTELMKPVPAPRVESRIGTSADLTALVTAAHDATSANGHGIKVLFDYVMKHADVDSGLYQAHPDWFYEEEGAFPLCSKSYILEGGGAALGWDHPVYSTLCAFTPYLAPFDFSQDKARAWSVNDAVYWAKKFEIDGYRLDAVKHVTKDWLRDLRTLLDKEVTKPAGDRFYLVGETFDYADRDKIKEFVDPDKMLDGQFDFPLKQKLCEAVFLPSGSMQTLSTWMASNDGYYGEHAIMSTWLGNHDVPRAIHFANREFDKCWRGSDADPASATYNTWTTKFKQPTAAAPYERLAIAFAIIMTSRGVPLIYYGDEVGLAGGGDPDDRRMMPWDDSKLNAHQKVLRSKVTALARARGQYPILARGIRETLSVNQRTWVYRLKADECDEPGAVPVIVAINGSDEPQTVTIPKGNYTDLVSHKAQAGGKIVFEARSFKLLREGK